MGTVFSQKSIYQIVNLFILNPPKFRFYRNYPPFLKVKNKSDSYFRVLFLNNIHVKYYVIPHTQLLGMIHYYSVITNYKVK